MRLTAAVFVAVLTAIATGAAAYTVEDAVFLVSILDGEGNARSVEADVVPYLPNRACFGWRIRLAGAPSLVRTREVLKLPAAPAFWSGENDPYSPHTFSADRRTATTEEFAAPDADGWISSTWCLAEGDPVGPHSVEIYIDGELVRRFDFEVKRMDKPAEK